MASKEVVIADDGTALCVELDCGPDAVRLYNQIRRASPGDVMSPAIRLKAEDLKTIAEAANIARGK